MIKLSPNNNFNDRSNTSGIMVSISCITYNHEKFIKDTLNGFFMQKTNFKFEILIHDDASIDKTVEIIKEFEDKYPGVIKPIYQTENQYTKFGGGMNPRFNYPRAKGKYIALCEGDDYWTDPNKLQKQVDFLEANEGFVLTGHDARIVDDNGVEIKKSKLPKERCRDATDLELKLGFWILTLSMVFRNVIQEDYLELINNKNVVNGDTVLISYLGQFGKYHYMPEIEPAVYRVHAQGVWSMKSESFRVLKKLYLNDHLANYFSKKNDPVANQLYTRVFNITQAENNKTIFSEYTFKDKVQVSIFKYKSYFKVYGLFRTIYYTFFKQIFFK